MSVRIDHVGIAVRDIDERLEFWTEALGLPLGGRETVPSEGVTVAFLRAGGARVELLEPSDDSSPIARHLERRGEGMHHLTLAVDRLAPVLDRLRERGAEVLGDGSRVGADGRPIAFIHPRSAGGVLIELVERPEPAAEAFDLGPGSTVLLYLREPHEKLWGVLRRLDVAGAVVESIDLGSFDECLTELEQGEESLFGFSLLFVPMSRIEKILLDRASGSLPSLADRFERRLGRSVQEILSETRQR